MTLEHLYSLLEYKRVKEVERDIDEEVSGESCGCALSPHVDKGVRKLLLSPSLVRGLPEIHLDSFEIWFLK